MLNRAFADFFASGDAGGRTLGIDVAAPGVFVPAPSLAPATVARVTDYEVQLDGGADDPLRDRAGRATSGLDEANRALEFVESLGTRRFRWWRFCHLLERRGR